MKTPKDQSAPAAGAPVDADEASGKNEPPAKKHYPSTRYHPKHGAVRVENPEHEAEIAPVESGWHETPAGFPAPEPSASFCSECGQAVPPTKAK